MYRARELRRLSRGQGRGVCHSARSRQPIRGHWCTDEHYVVGVSVEAEGLGWGRRQPSWVPWLRLTPAYDGTRERSLPWQPICLLAESKQESESRTLAAHHDIDILRRCSCLSQVSPSPDSGHIQGRRTPLSDLLMALRGADERRERGRCGSSRWLRGTTVGRSMDVRPSCRL
jgi:hypothetical protein